MKQRVITSVIALGVLAVALFLFETIFVNIIIAAISVIAVYELLSATGCMKMKSISIPSILLSALIPFITYQGVQRYQMVICYVYVIVLFIGLLRNHQKLEFSKLAISFMLSLVVPFALSTLIYMRDRHGGTLGLFFVLVALCSAWGSDTCAYFVGSKFGKHRLAPVISPKKSVEGAIGGAVGGTLMNLLLVWGYSLVCRQVGTPISINYLLLAVVSPVFSVSSILGDLSASVIKRQNNVKDYGSIMPGHGGIMDRFDSVLTVAPLVYILSMYVPLVS